MRKGTIVICVVVMLISMCALAFAGGNVLQRCAT
jgi:hypothetical protein